MDIHTPKTTPFSSQEALNLTKQRDNRNDELDLAQLISILWTKKIFIIVISTLFAIGSIFFALSKPDVYRASAILSPVASDSGVGGLSSLANQFGGLANMAGISIGGGNTDKTALSLEILKSRLFLENFIESHNLVVPLVAGKNWDIKSNALIIDDTLYDTDNNRWIRKVDFPKEAIPSTWEAYQELLELLTISQDKSTSIVTISIDFYSPTLAKQWLTWLISDINEYVRKQDQIETQASIDYLTNQLEKIQVSNMESIFYQLIEDQTKNMMLIKVKKEYVLKTIDPPQVPETKEKPKRALIVVLGSILGGVLSILIVIIRYLLTNNNKQLN